MKKWLNGQLVDMSQSDIDQYNADAQAWEDSRIDRMAELFSRELQHHIDGKAQSKNYDNGFACASYANSTNATWASEAQAFVAWRDDCWQYAINVQNDVESGTIDAPSLDDFMAGVPILNW